MTSTIQDKLKDIEEKHGVTVLYACETGSRAWGFPSPDSDYDVRMIYKHDLDWYLSLNEQKDTIDFMSEDSELDITGWDIRKCFKLMWKSNGALLERVQSPIVYRNKGNIADQLKDYAFRCFSPIATMHHYMGMAKNTFSDIEGKDEVKLKSLFYALRASLACKWIADQDTPPPIVFATMVNTLSFSEQIKDRIAELVILKSGRPESYMHPAEYELNNLIAAEITAAERIFESLRSRKEKEVELDLIFRQIVKSS